MNNSRPILLASASIWGAVVSAPLVCIISGPTFSTAVNQDAMVLRFLWLVAFLVLSLLAVKRAKEICEPQDKKRIEILGAVLWLPGTVLNWHIMNTY